LTDFFVLYEIVLNLLPGPLFCGVITELDNFSVFLFFVFMFFEKFQYFVFG